jgi:hypothetical protein
VTLFAALETLSQVGSFFSLFCAIEAVMAHLMAVEANERTIFFLPISPRSYQFVVDETLKCFERKETWPFVCSVCFAIALPILFAFVGYLFLFSLLFGNLKREGRDRRGFLCFLIIFTFGQENLSLHSSVASVDLAKRER